MTNPPPRRQYLKRDASKDNLRTYSFAKDAGSVYPDFSFVKVMQMIDNDPVARGALTSFIDACMEGDYAILKEEDLSYDREFEKRLDTEFNFRHEIIRTFFVMSKMFKNVFIEIVKNTDGSVKALNVLDSNNIEPVLEPNGDVIKYLSKIPNPITGQKPEWSKDEVVWYKIEDRKAGYAPIDFKSLWENLLAKKYVKDLVAWLFKTNQYRVLYNFKNASDKDIDDVLAYMRKNENNFNAPLFLKGEAEQTIVRDMKEADNLINLLKYYDSQTLVAMREPPIDAGIPDASGRSNADAQSNSKSTHITSVKKVFEDVTNYKLFPLINKGNSIIRFAPNNRFEEKQVWENISLMVAANMSEDFIREYLQDRGLFYGAKKIFKTPEEMLAASGKMAGDGGTSATGQSIGAPSRASSVDLNKQGTGEAASTRSDQVTSK